MSEYPVFPMPFAYVHIMDNTGGIPGNRPNTVLTKSAKHPFGLPGVDYSREYPVTRKKLFTEEQVRRIVDAAIDAAVKA